MGEIRIRPAQITDARTLAKIGADNFPGYPFRSIFEPASLARGMIAMNSAIGAITPDYRVVIEDNLGIVGTAVLGSPDDKMVEIKRVLVDQRGRNNGYARNMTIHLAELARNRMFYPYADVRADQRGMQKAACAAGLSPFSLEPAKHVVYSHVQDGAELGPARETMIHMSSLEPDERGLYNQINTSWPEAVKKLLVANMQKSFSPRAKNLDISRRILTSAEDTKLKIDNGIKETGAAAMSMILNDDMVVISDGHTQLLVIKPDASGFLLNAPSDSLPQLLTLAHQIGLQVVTYYGDVAHTDVSLLINSGMEPVMIRPWKLARRPTIWQAGWQKTMNGYDQCIHTIDLESQVYQQLQGFINDLSANL